MSPHASGYTMCLTMAENKVVKDEQSETNRDVEEYEAKLDFFSDTFDPLLALNAPGTSAPISNARRYDNLAAYKSAIEREKNPEKFQKKSETVIKTDVPVERRWLPHQMPVQTQRKGRYNRNIFTKMERMHGPLALLTKCVQEKLRIKVYTKNAEKTRGYCLAYVVAFDKHFNMALEDVTEVWTRRKKKKVPALDSAKSEKKFKFQRQFKFPEIKVNPHPTERKLEVCTRQVNQIMLRGEHVVLVSVIARNEVDKKEEKEDKKEENTER